MNVLFSTCTYAMKSGRAATAMGVTKVLVMGAKPCVLCLRYVITQ